jgi:nucleoside-diphosphate-sugar epimerase
VRSIAVLGANGQVGMEVCLFLSVLGDVRVIPIVRSELAAAYLARCGLPCRVGSAASPAEAGRLLADADLVVDLSLPPGQPSQVRSATRAVIANATRQAPPGAGFAYMSSTMAFGMPAAASAYRHHRVARTSYASQKRHGERLALRLGRAHGRPAFALRLGQVHGELQGVSRQMRLSAGRGPVGLRRGGEVPSDTVFCSTIALALRNIAHGMEVPGLYTLLESPEWSWREVHEYYARLAGVAARIVPIGERGGACGGFSRLGRALGARAADLAVRHKELWNAQLLPALSRLPGLGQLDLRLRGPYLRRRAAAEIRAGEGVWVPGHLDGPVPGRRLRSLRDSGPAMEEASRRVRALLEERFGPEGHNLPMRRDEGPPEGALGGARR